MSIQGQVNKFGAVVLQNLPEIPGDLMQWWIENPLELQVVLGNLCTKPEPKFDAWRTIKLGTGKTVADFRHALRDGNLKLSEWASDILGQPAFTVATEEIEVDLVRVSVAELGFSQGTRRDQIFERAMELGLELCPPEVGPQLRLQYRDQPNNEWLLIGMEPIIDSDGDPDVFGVERDGSERWLHSNYGEPVHFWPADSQWVFVFPRK